MTTFELAKELFTTDDESMAEVFAYYNRFRDTNRIEKGLKRENMDFNVSELTMFFEKTLKEIIFSEEVDTYAWWKDDTFFGRNTPKAKFLAQNDKQREGMLMETAMRGQEILCDLLSAGKVNTDNVGSFEVWGTLKDLAYAYEYAYYDNDDGDFLDKSETFFKEKLLEMYGVKTDTVSITVFKDDVIKGWQGNDNLMEIKVARPVAFAWFKETTLESFKGDDNTSDEGLFDEWLDEYTADGTIGLYDWLVNRGFGFKIHDTERSA